MIAHAEDNQFLQILSSGFTGCDSTLDGIEKITYGLLFIAIAEFAQAICAGEVASRQICVFSARSNSITIMVLSALRIISEVYQSSSNVASAAESARMALNAMQFRMGVQPMSENREPWSSYDEQSTPDNHEGLSTIHDIE
ncbi:hypothetical protein WOLCODRAFT_19254 [Wolfiporia cocos MD-104 SS10]|uniref:Uncharacterized protein n=1 Tax=Wolfiporia cocos (strain MD-104) TaxID=742152 RepID=A0A2H3JRY8_WOLCO|nr:hypothetical protein WOLCODRAFT_19254 [Wolfiporia cocos MD-104 SS10]